MSQVQRQAFEQLARFKPSTSCEERLRKSASSAPSESSAEFEEYLASWTSLTGTKLTAPFISSVLSGADEGSASELATLFQTILEKEPAIAAHIQTRILAVLACDWTVHGDNPAKAAEVEGILKKARIRSLLWHLLDAVPTGYAGSAILWGEGGSLINGFRHVHPANWIFDVSGNPALLTLSGREKPLASYHPRQFVFHTHSLKPGIPSRGGLLRSLVWLYFFKHYAMRDRARYLERFGIPFILAKIRRDDFDDSSVRGSILNSLSKVGSDGVGVVTEGSDLQVIDGSSNSANDFQSWMEYIDRLCALLVLGQTATSGDASGLSRGQAQENVRRDIIEADCKNLMETVDSQILHPLEEYRYGTSGTLRFSLDYSSPESLSEKAQIVKSLADAGYHASPDWIQRTFGIQLAQTEK